MATSASARWRERRPPGLCLAAECRSGAFLRSAAAGCFSGALAAVVRFSDEAFAFDLGPVLPDLAIFSAFITLASLVAAFRMSNALTRFTLAGGFMHKMMANWYDATSTLIAFSRASDCQPEDVENFRQVLVRLISLLSALSMSELQSVDEEEFCPRTSFRFEVLPIEALDADSRDHIRSSTHRVEAVFQMIQSLVVDAHRSGVLSIAPPLLTRSFQELGLALSTFHEAKMIACEPFPYAYRLTTFVILFIQLLFVPFMVANFATGWIGSFIFAFLGTFILWFVNMVADSLDNPFRKEANALDVSIAQMDLNEYLLQMLASAGRPSPSVDEKLQTQAHRGFSSNRRSELRRCLDRPSGRCSDEAPPTTPASVPVPGGAPSLAPPCADVGDAGRRGRRATREGQVPRGQRPRVPRFAELVPGTTFTCDSSQPVAQSATSDDGGPAPASMRPVADAETAGRDGRLAGDVFSLHGSGDDGSSSCDYVHARCRSSPGRLGMFSVRSEPSGIVSMRGKDVRRELAGCIRSVLSR